MNRNPNCTLCQLHKTCKTTCIWGEPEVFSQQMKVMILGETPGKHEDKEGRLFVGVIGDVFENLLKVAGLKRGEVYVTNVVKCRTPKDRKATPNEIHTCFTEYLTQEINTHKPEIIVTLGLSAYQSFFPDIFEGGSVTMSKIRSFGSINWNQIKLFPTYHPAIALHNPAMMPILVADFRKLKAILEKRI